MGKCGTPARLSVAFQAVLTVEIGWSGRCGLGKTNGLLGACASFHACNTLRAYSDKGTGSAEPGVFTSLSKRMSLFSRSTWSQRSDFGKQKWVAARPFWAPSARSRLRQKRFVLWVKRRVREVQMDFPLNPSAKLPHCGLLALLVLQDCGGVPVLREAFLYSATLVIQLQPCD